MSSNESTLDDTGERMVPELTEPRTFWEHLYRYRFASQFICGKRVLDVACGEGYGTHGLLRAGAMSVIGVAISEEACEHARRKYGVDARCGSATELRIPDRSVDVVVSFETIEHIQNPALFVKECERVLASDGVLVISTPNRQAYINEGSNNPFHCSELSESEFCTMLRSKFESLRLYSQAAITAGVWSLRSLASLRPLWHRVRGYWRLQRILCRSFPWYGSGASVRSAPAEVIAGRDSFLSNVLNPYRVRQRSAVSRERPTFFLAVCRKATKPGTYSETNVIQDA